MKAAVLAEKGRFEMREFPMPEPDDDSVLVKMEACAVCNATDTKLFKGTHAMAVYPSIIGHEGVGVVEAAGKNVTKLKVGDRILGGSFYCREMPSLWGAYSQYGVSGENALVVPETVGAKEASLAFMLSEAVNAVRIADIKAGDNVLIIGAGAVGFSLLSILKNTLHLRVIVVDIADEKLKLALRLGADAVINSQKEDVALRVKECTDQKGVNKIFEAVGNQATYQLAFELITWGGVIVPFGMMEGTMEIPFRTMYAKEVQMKWCKGSGVQDLENKRIALSLLEKGLINTELLITGEIPLENVSEAFERIAAGKEIRIILTM